MQPASQQKPGSQANESASNAGGAPSGAGLVMGIAVYGVQQRAARAAQEPSACLTEQNARIADGAKLPPKPPRAAKRLKFSELAADVAGATHPACASAVAALSLQLGRPTCQMALPDQAEGQAHASTLETALFPPAPAATAGQKNVAPVPADTSCGAKSSKAPPLEGQRAQVTGRASAEHAQAPGCNAAGSQKPAATKGAPADNQGGTAEGARYVLSPSRSPAPVALILAQNISKAEFWHICGCCHILHKASVYRTA